MTETGVSRVRCVLACDGRYLLVQHDNHDPQEVGKWGLPGGILDAAEDPASGLRREIEEELYITMPDLVLLGDWAYRDEVHRVFGCEIGERIADFDSYELLAISWLTFEEVQAMDARGRLHTGFELAAVTALRASLSG